MFRMLETILLILRGYKNYGCARVSDGKHAGLETPKRLHPGDIVILGGKEYYIIGKEAWTF